jgi:hypothetical protein
MVVTLLAAAAVFLLAGQSRAVPISLIDETTDPQPSGSGDAVIVAWLNALISDYNADHGTSLPEPVTEDFRVNQGDLTAPAGYPTFGAGVLTIAIPAGYDYIVLHWGGSGGGVYEAYDLIGITGLVTYNAPGRNGLSWYELLGPGQSVPEPATLLLLGGGLVGLGIFRRKSK